MTPRVVAAMLAAVGRLCGLAFRGYPATTVIALTVVAMTGGWFAGGGGVTLP